MTGPGPTEGENLLDLAAEWATLQAAPDPAAALGVLLRTQLDGAVTTVITLGDQLVKMQFLLNTTLVTCRQILDGEHQGEFATARDLAGGILAGTEARLDEIPEKYQVLLQDPRVLIAVALRNREILLEILRPVAPA